MKAELRYQDNALIFEDIRYDAELGRATEYCQDTLVSIRAISGHFSGVSVFECSFDRLKHFAESLAAIYDLQAMKASLDNDRFGGHVFVDMSKTGRLTIGGTLREDYDGQELCFQFEADQTALPTFIRALNETLNAIHVRN